MKTPEQGAATSVYLARDIAKGEANGKYYVDMSERRGEELFRRGRRRVVVAAFGGAHGRVFRFDLIRFGDSFCILLGICIAIALLSSSVAQLSLLVNFGFRAGFGDATL